MRKGIINKYEKLPSALKQKWSREDFYYYRMQNMTLPQIENIATPDELWDREKELNDDSLRYIFNDKREFYRLFRRNEFCFNRDVLILDNASREEYKSFIEKYHRVILKPCDMYAGIGIYLIEAGCLIRGSFGAEYSSAPEAGGLPDFADLKEKHYIAEEYVYQAAEYANIYPGSLNTIRVTTYITDDGKTEMLFAVNQFGSSGSIVDNNDDTAIWGGIDIETGIITAPDIDEKSGLVFDIHPDTHVKVVGFKNPCWKKVCNLALKLAAAVPQCRLIGWDIAIRNDYSIELIEGNVTPELDLYQRISAEGLRNRLEIKSKEIK